MSALTVAMIVKNEEQFIERVIHNVQPVADEIVITDTGSTDNSIDIIKKYKVILFHNKWDGNEAHTRNFTISKCKTDWILFIDADEFIDIRHYQKIRALISNKDKYIAYRILCRDYFDPRVNFRNLYQKDWKGSYNLYSITRIFKNREDIFYSRPVYITVDESLRSRSDKVGNSDVVFHHLDILRNKKKKLEKRKWYKHDVFINLKRFPDNPEVNYAAAHYYMLRGKFKEAIKYYKKTLKISPGYVKAKLSLGLSYVMLGEEKEGTKIIKLCKNDEDVHPWEMESYLNTAYKIIAGRMLKK